MRPTSERVRESLFGILGAVIERASVLDLFAGSGALGLEALSRGATRATLVERNRAVLRVLRANVEYLGVADRCRILPVDALYALRAPGPFAPFDIVFVDPPYDRTAEPILVAIERAARLRDGATVVLERNSSSPQLQVAGGLSLFRSERYGQSRLDFHRYRSTRPGSGSLG